MVTFPQVFWRDRPLGMIELIFFSFFVISVKSLSLRRGYRYSAPDSF